MGEGLLKGRRCRVKGGWHAVGFSLAVSVETRVRLSALSVFCLCTRRGGTFQRRRFLMVLLGDLKRVMHDPDKCRISRAKSPLPQDEISRESKTDRVEMHVSRIIDLVVYILCIVLRIAPTKVSEVSAGSQCHPPASIPADGLILTIATYRQVPLLYLYTTRYPTVRTDNNQVPSTSRLPPSSLSPQP
ncbi:hypothetical protein Cob_v012717 [Colletotrichum orbiculare MAFF 240422]|uniref:Uncharacterized protein n=1 Tax=Colletotrichum orbiculare (strain 104-T / ATCC 96160 / CBS 514.97 / LARS 414 / MAFF 240422) TaxID=1213857 RepID=A0A484FA41_COLOR|nr:hypothetical protein Cob_v012717 [Colletotrichum orbiculare MAFF 240422]